MKLRRILSVVSVIAIMLGTMFFSTDRVFAAGLPDSTKDGDSSITIHKYGIDSSFAASSSFQADGKVVSDSTVIGQMENESGVMEDVTLGQLNQLQNIPFMIERLVEKKDVNGEVITPVEYEVDSTFTADTQSTGANGLLTFDALDFGIYRITEQPSAAVTKPADPMIVSVPMVNPEDENEWLYDIHVYPKNEIAGPDIDKSVSIPGNQHETADLTENVKWIITSEIPADMATSMNYVITDTMDDVLRFNENSLEVSYINTGGTKVILSNGTDYALNYIKGSNVYPWADSFVVTLTAAGRANVGNGALPNPLPANTTLPRLTLEFSTRFDIPADKVLDYLGEPIENKAKLDYTNSAGVSYDPETEVPEVHTGGVRLKKVDPNGNTLSGAEFKIYTSEADAKSGNNALKDPTNSSADWVVTSGTNGMAEFLGLAYGDKAIVTNTNGLAYNNPGAETSYWIVEVKAPVDTNGKSYNLLTAPLEVKVNATSHEDANIIKVVNSKFTLPLTGGSGTLLFIVVGILLIGAGALCLTKFRKAAK